jgi:hypothetical protein
VSGGGRRRNTPLFKEERIVLELLTLLSLSVLHMISSKADSTKISEIVVL